MLPRRALATPETCVHTRVEDGVAYATAWPERITLEASQLLLPLSTEQCVNVEVRVEHPDVVSLQVSYAGETRSALLPLDDVAPASRPRVGALVVTSLLRELLSSSRSVRGDGTPAAAESPSPDSGREQGRVARAAADPEKPPFLQPREKGQATHDTLWSLQSYIGGRFFLAHKPQLGRLELAVTRDFTSRERLRASVALFGEFTRVRTRQTRVLTASAGLRPGLDVAALRTPGAELWVGPGVEVQALLLAVGAESEPKATQSSRAVFTAGVRASSAFLVGETMLLAALDVGGVVTPVRVRYDGQTQYAYKGVYVGLLLGIEHHLLATQVPGAREE